MNHRNDSPSQQRGIKNIPLQAPSRSSDLPITDDPPDVREDKDYDLTDEKDDARTQNRVESQEYDDNDFGQDQSGGYGSGYSGGSYGYGMSPHAEPYKPSPEADYKPMQYWGGEASDHRGAPKGGGENGSRLGNAYQHDGVGEKDRLDTPDDDAADPNLSASHDGDQE